MRLVNEIESLRKLIDIGIRAKASCNFDEATINLNRARDFALYLLNCSKEPTTLEEHNRITNLESIVRTCSSELKEIKFLRKEFPNVTL